MRRSDGLPRRGSKLCGRLEEAIAMYESGMSFTDIAKEFDMNPASVFRTLGSRVNKRSRGEAISLAYSRLPEDQKRRMEKSNRWKGGRIINDQGYVLLKVPEHPKANSIGYVREHIIIAEKALGRPLKKREVVHHLDEKRSNNTNNNLVVMSHDFHQWLHGIEPRKYVRRRK